jgi:hypothetical protein
MKKWAFDFFGKRSIKTILWWNKMPKILDNKDNKVVRGVDIILKTVKFEKDKLVTYFIDQENETYILKLKFAVVLDLDVVVKLRNVSIQFEKNRKYITIESSSSCLILPPSYFDVKMFEPEFYAKNAKYVVLTSPLKVKRPDEFKTKRDFLSKYPYLEDYYFEEILIGKKNLIKNPSKKKIECAEASIIQKMYTNRIPVYLNNLKNLSNIKKEDALYQKVVISAYIAEIKEINPKKMVFKYCDKCGKVKSFFNYLEFECCKNLMGICLLIKIYVQDESLNGDESFPIYIMTKKTENDPFLLWNILPASQEYKKWTNINQEQLNDFKSKLDALKKFSEKIKFVVELKKTEKGSYFFEICNTLFTP